MIATNRGPETADAAPAADAVVPQHLVVGRCAADKPALRVEIAAPKGARGRCRPSIPTLGDYCLYGRHDARSCCSPRTRATPSGCGACPTPRPYVKDAFHRRVIDGEEGAVNPEQHRHQIRAPGTRSRSSRASRDASA